ncbi:hypothetical protein FNF28_02413 [Cafeteria roenbergensis]|uniref:Transmembrane protein n=1 Tax=Cafeteria roenbergensis TaxID=33653 RepID=A0A5A8DVH6_CAFRO|nr:hypothetical protein FNF28_02413 [Cafeteria roenbergensis]
MSARRPRVIRKEFTTGDGLDLGKPVNISTRFANEYPPECALDMVKSRLDYHGRPAGAPGADRRLATFSRGIWVQRLATFLFSVTIIVTASGMLSFCLFRDYCFRNKPAASPVVLVLAFPVAAVVIFCLGPLGLTAISLRMRGCMAFTVLFLVACCVTLLVGSILALTTLEPDTISRVSTAGWASLSPLEKRAYTGGIEELRSVIEGDAIVVGTFGVLSSVLLTLATIFSAATWTQWGPYGTDEGCCGSSHTGPLRRLDGRFTVAEQREHEELSGATERAAEAEREAAEEDADQAQQRQSRRRLAEQRRIAREGARAAEGKQAEAGGEAAAGDAKDASASDEDDSGAEGGAARGSSRAGQVLRNGTWRAWGPRAAS